MPGADVVAGRFALCDPLARGAAGTVWRTWDLRLGDWCAAKVMRQRDAGDLLRFAREQQVRLEHPHLLTPYSWAAEYAHVVLASRLVGGGSPHTLLGDHGPLARRWWPTCSTRSCPGSRTRTRPGSCTGT